MEPLAAAVIQMRHRESLRENLAAADAHLAAARGQGARLALLPEYFFVPDGARPDLAWVQECEAIQGFLQEASRRHGLALVGNLLEREGDRVLNVAYAYEDGHLRGRQPKIHPMPGEARVGIAPYARLEAFDLAGIRTGILVCADILYPEAARILSLQGAELLLNPVMSPHHERDLTQQARSALYIARAYDAGAFVLKAGGFTTSRTAVGRSLIAAPWGLLAKYEDEWREALLHAHLDVKTLRGFRETHRGLQDRQPAAYRALVE